MRYGNSVESAIQINEIERERVYQRDTLSQVVLPVSISTHLLEVLLSCKQIDNDNMQKQEVIICKCTNSQELNQILLQVPLNSITSVRICICCSSCIS